MKRLANFFIAAIFLLNVGGCALLLAGTAGGAGTAVWLSGKLSQEVSASYEQTIAATKSGLKDLKLDVNKETKSSEVDQIKSTYTDGREVWIDIRPVTSSSTKIEVRVGAVGDKAAADTILKQIRKHL